MTDGIVCPGVDNWFLGLFRAIPAASCKVRSRSFGLSSNPKII